MKLLNICVNQRNQRQKTTAQSASKKLFDADFTKDPDADFADFAEK
jgi:hypothetical protein